MSNISLSIGVLWDRELTSSIEVHFSKKCNFFSQWLLNQTLFSVKLYNLQLPNNKLKLITKIALSHRNGVQYLISLTCLGRPCYRIQDKFCKYHWKTTKLSIVRAPFKWWISIILIKRSSPSTWEGLPYIAHNAWRMSFKIHTWSQLMGTSMRYFWIWTTFQVSLTSFSNSLWKFCISESSNWLSKT